MKHWLVRRTLESILPSTDELPGLSETELEAFLDQFNRDAPPIMKVALTGAAAAYNLATPITVGQPVPAVLLPKRLLNLHAERAAYHRLYILRQTVLLLKTVGGMCWGADPDIRAQLNLDPYASDPGTWKQT